MEAKKLKLYKLAKYTNLEIVMEAQVQGTGANQAKLMERFKKNKKSIQHQVMALKIVYAFLIFMTAIVPLFTTLQILDGLKFGTLSIETILFGGTFLFGVFFITQFLYLLLLGMLNISAMMTGEAFRWYETLPISKRQLQKLGFLTVIRNLDIALVMMIVAFPIIIAIITQNILLIIISVLISILNVVFVLSVLVLIAERISRVFRGDQVNSKKATVLRIFTTLSYFIVAFSGSLLVQWAINATFDIFLLFSTSPIPEVINFILGLIPFPFAAGNILTLFIDPTQFPPNMWISGLIGFGLLIFLTWFLYNRAVKSMRSVTIASAIEVKSGVEKKAVEDIVVEVVTRSPIKAYRKKDLSSATKDMQTLMYLILPILVPFIYSIILIMSIGSAVGSFEEFDVLIFWSVLMFYQPMISIMITTGFLNMEDGGASILAGLPLYPRDQAKAKLSVLLTIQTVSFFIPSLLFLGSPVFGDYILLFLAWYPISLVFLFTMFVLKIRLFGRMKYKYVLEEVNPKKKTLKWILMIASEGLILVIYIISGGLLLTFYGLVPMILTLSITSLLILTGLVISVNRMFPKVMGKRIMISMREALRKRPLLGTFILLIFYFVFLLAPAYTEFLFLPLYSILPIDILAYLSLFIEFVLGFGFMMLFWLLVVPKSLRLPIGKTTFMNYLKAIKLPGTELKKSKLLLNIILGLICALIYFGSAWLFANILGDYVFDLSIVFGPPRIIYGGIIYGWFIFIIMLIPGIWEEWAFRGVVIPLNLRKYSKTTVIILSATFFGVFHLFNIIVGQDWVNTIFQVFFATALGFLFGYIYIKTNSLLPSIMVHYLVNSLGQLFVNALFYNDVSYALFLIFGIGLVPATLGIIFIYIMTKYVFPKTYQY